MFSDATSQLLERALTVRTEKHERLADNLANVDTPGYRPGDVDFAASLQAATQAGASTTHAGHLRGGDLDVIETRGAESAPTADGNTVDLDRTMAALAENGTQYSSTAKFLQKRMALLRYVSSDGLG